MQIGSMPQMPNQVGGPPPGGPRGPGGPGGPHKAAMDGAAEALGLSQTELRERLEAGNSLADIAGEVGVDTEELKAAMVSAIEETAPADAVERMTAEIDGMIEGTGPTRRPPPPPPDVNPSEALEELATAMDLSTQDLLAAIEDGSFADLLKSEGVDTSRGFLVDQQS